MLSYFVCWGGGRRKRWIKNSTTDPLCNFWPQNVDLLNHQADLLKMDFRQILLGLKIESKFFVVRFVSSSSSKHKLIIPLKTYWFWTFAPPKSLFLLFLQMCLKNQRHKKCNNEGQIWNQHHQISLKQIKIFFKKFVQSIIFFSKFGPFLVIPLDKTQLSVYQKMFLVIWQLPNSEKLESQKKTHPSVVLIIAIPLSDLILVTYYIWLVWY